MTDDAITIETLDYRDGDLHLQGLLAMPACGGSDERRPTVLLVPAVFGLTQHARERARHVAALGYVVLVADLHGGGAAFSSLEEAMPRGTALMEDVPVWRARLNAALAALAGKSGVDCDRIAVIGFGLGGTGALDLACSGVTIAAASRHYQLPRRAETARTLRNAPGRREHTGLYRSGGFAGSAFGR